MSAFCSVQMISLPLLQLILEVIKNGSKTLKMPVRRVEFFSLFSHSVFHIWHRLFAVHWWVHSPDPVARAAMRSHPHLGGRLGSASTAPQGCSGQAGAVPKPPSPPSLPPTSWAPPAALAPSLVRAMTHAHSPHFLQMQSGRSDKHSA